MSSCSTPLVGTNTSHFFSPNEKVHGLSGKKLCPYSAIFVRKVDGNTSIIRWDSEPKVEVRIQTSMIISINSTSGTRSRTRRSSGPTTPTCDTPSSMEHSAIKRQKLFGNSPPKVSNDLPQRVAKVFTEDNQLYFGSAVSYDGQLWTIKYDDGDVEEYSESEMSLVLHTYKRKEHLDADGGGNHDQGQNPSSGQAITGNESSSEEEEEELVDHSPSDDDDDSSVCLVHTTRKREHDRTRGGDYYAGDSSSVSSIHSRERLLDTAAAAAASVHSTRKREHDRTQGGDYYAGDSSSVSSIHSRERLSDTAAAASVHSTRKREHDRTQGGDYYAGDSSSVSSIHSRERLSDTAAAASVHSTRNREHDRTQGGDHYAGDSSSVSSIHSREERLSDTAAADSSSMDESSGGESDNELWQLKERYIQHIKLPESYNIEDFACKTQKDDISVGIEVSTDADSFVYGTQNPVDFHSVNSTEEFRFQIAKRNMTPFSVRPAIKKTRYFKPSYVEGKTPTMPSKLHKFPSFSAGIVKFKGGVTAYLSIHVLEATQLGSRCSTDVINTWNAANNLALTDYRESSVGNDPDWEEEMNFYRKEHAPQTYSFNNIEASNKEMGFPGIIGILHLRIVYEMLGKIATGSYGEKRTNNDYPRDPVAAMLLCTHSFILLQAPGFKKQWGMMQSQHDKQKAEVFPVMNYENEYAIWNQKLKAMTIDTYQRAEAFFIDLPGLEHKDHDASTFYAIDIAFKFSCTDDNWDVLLSGEAAEDTVVAATKLRRSELREVDEERTEQDEPSEEVESSDSDDAAYQDSDPDEEDSLSSRTPTDSSDQERTDDNDPESQPEDQVTDNDDDGPISQLLQLMGSHDYTSNPDIISRQAPEGHEMHTAELLESAATLHSGQRNRIRYPTFGTTGVSFGNAQSKPGINLEAIYDDDGAVQVFHPAIPEGKLRSVCLAQMYQPYQRFGMGVQTMVKTRMEARKLPKMIAEYASEFENLLVLGDSSTKVFTLIDEVFAMIEEYLIGVDTHPFHVRYELTFVTDMNRRMDILPPINDSISPFKCVRIAKKADILASMKKQIEMHRDVIHGFRRLEIFPNLFTTMHPDEWTAIIASAEAVVNFIGMGGGAKGTILKQSLDKSAEFFFNHYWMAHPEFITLLPPRVGSLEGNINQGGTDIIRFGVDSNLLAFATPQRAIEDEAPNITNLRSLDYVDGPLSMYLLEGLPKLDEPAPYRKCMLLIYTALLAAGKEAGNSEEEVTIFDRIQWTGVGLQVASVSHAFKEIAAALVALYKVEWANRNTRCIEKKLGRFNSEDGARTAANFGKKRKQFVLDLRDSHTKSELGILIRDCLGNDWPFDLSPFDSNDNIMTKAGRAT
jgi:hypothetical protein